MHVEIWSDIAYEGELAAHVAEKYGMTIDEARERQQHLVDLAAAAFSEGRLVSDHATLGAAGAHPPDALLGLLRQGWDAAQEPVVAGRR